MERPLELGVFFRFHEPLESLIFWFLGPSRHPLSRGSKFENFEGPRFGLLGVLPLARLDFFLREKPP